MGVRWGVWAEKWLQQRVIRARFARSCSDLTAIQLPAQHHPLDSTTSAGIRQEARRRVVSEHGTSREIAKKAVLVLDRGPVKYPSMPNQPPPIPTAGGGPEDQRMPCFGSREKAFGNLRSQELEGYPSTFFFRCFGRQTPDALAKFRPGYPPASWGHFCTPPCRGAGNVRAGTEPGARFGRADSPGAPTGWAILPDPQQPRGGETRSREAPGS